MLGSGFIMIVANALDYLLGWNTELSPIGIIGLVFVAIGLKWIRIEEGKK